MTNRIKIIFLSLLVIFLAFFFGYLKYKQSSSFNKESKESLFSVEKIEGMKSRLMNVSAEINLEIISDLEKKEIINPYNCKGVIKNFNSKISTTGPLKGYIHPISLNSDDIVAYNFCIGERLLVLSTKQLIEVSENKKTLSSFVNIKQKNYLPEIVLSPIEMFLEGF